MKNDFPAKHETVVRPQGYVGSIHSMVDASLEYLDTWAEMRRRGDFSKLQMQYVLQQAMVTADGKDHGIWRF